MAKFKHLKIEQRYQIEAMLALKISPKNIAAKIGKHISTVYREINRGQYLEQEVDEFYSKFNGENSRVVDTYSYSAIEAQDRYLEKRDFKSWFDKKWYTSEWEKEVKPLLKIGWSPEQISGRLKLENGFKISYQSIYRGIRELGDHRCTFLSEPDPFYKDKIQKYRKRYSKKKRKIYPRTKKVKTSIDERSEHINDRSEEGHWERDLFYGKREQESMIAFVERVSRFKVVAKLDQATAENVLKETIKLAEAYEVRSITNDNGPEFWDFEEVQKHLNIPVYFANPYSPWERGSVEHAIKRLRNEFPKKESISHIKQEEQDAACLRENLKPMKLHKFKTPYEVFNNVDICLTVKNEQRYLIQ